MLSKQLLQSPFCIYGAGIVATSIYTAIKTLYNKTPLFFLVSDSRGRGGLLDSPPAEIDGIAVKRLSDWKRELTISLLDCVREVIMPQTYLVAVPEAHHQSIVKTLHSRELAELSTEDSQIILFTNELENELMEAYYSSLANCTTVLNLVSRRSRQKDEHGQAENLSKMQIFQVKSHVDKPLYHSYTAKELQKKSGDMHWGYMYPIQAGAALTSQIIADLQDNTGENISAKNHNYCELTATYHAWKNSHATYKGICHYRRIFDINDEQMQALLSMEKDWDVILPYPSVYYPNIVSEHGRYVRDSDWDAMLQALRETAPEYFAAYEKAVADGEQFFNNFNMLIAKSVVFDDYCNFLFSVLERTEELTTPKGWERADRFVGYLGENLTTIYFLKNREKLKIAYAGKMWLT